MIIDLDSVESFASTSHHEPLFRARTKDAQTVVIKSHREEDHDRILTIGAKLKELQLSNFVAVLGPLELPDHNPYIAYEYVSSLSLRQALENNLLNFTQFLAIWIELLLALESGQRVFHFCHHDLHTDNVLLRSVSSPRRDFTIEHYRYTVLSRFYEPVIIDYDESSIRLNEDNLGNGRYHEHGLTKYGLSGVDMYKLLFHCYVRAGHELQKEIGQLFAFYGCNDPYNIVSCPRQQLHSISHTYLSNVTVSKVASFTPLEFVLWTKKNIPDCPLRISKRQSYMKVQRKEGSIQFELPRSYVLWRFISLLDPTVSAPAPKRVLIATDRETLLGYKNILLPKDNVVSLVVFQVLDLKLNENDEKCRDRFISVYKPIKQLQPYFQYLYTIKQLHLEKDFGKFVQGFTRSKQYRYAMKWSVLIERCRRWLLTVTDSQKV